MTAGRLRGRRPPAERPAYPAVTAAPPEPAACEPPRDCPACPRLVGYRVEQRQLNPTWHNAPVVSFGADSARLLIVGLAPGVSGANRTGRPFTGDFAGVLLYTTLLSFGFAAGQYGASADDGLALQDCMITNAVRCVPPQNKPLPGEIATCRPYFAARLASLSRLSAILALGRIAHDQVLATLGLKRSAYAFAHGACHDLPGDAVLFDSFHCSRYNTNTGRLTEAMFHEVFGAIRRHLDAARA